MSAIENDEALSAFVEWMRAREMSANTIRVRRSALVRLSTFLERPLVEATESDLLRWRRFSCHRRSLATGQVYVTAVRRFYAWTAATGRTIANPATHLRARTAAEIAAERRSRHEAEMDKVEEFFRQHPEAGLYRPRATIHELTTLGYRPTVNDLGLLRRH